MPTSNDALPYRFRNAEVPATSTWPGAGPASGIRHGRPPTAIDGGLRVEVKSLAEAASLAAEWAALADRALERNVFVEPAFALTAAQHLADARDVLAVLVWETARSGPSSPQLVGFFPVVWPRLPLVPGTVRGWRPQLSGLGTPLVDHGRAEAVIDAFLTYLGERGPRAAAMLFPMVPADGAFARALQAAVGRAGRMQRRFDNHKRAVLKPGAGTRQVPGSPLAPGSPLTAKKTKELRRQLRRLGDHGALRISSAHDPRAVRNAVELFLAIEASGWKRQRGTSLIQDAGNAAFIRTMTRQLARTGCCRIDVLTVGDHAVAAGIVIRSGDRAWFWKIAYDEAFARYSPGVQLALAVTTNQLGDDRVRLTNSCAIADHPMIDHLWPDRMAVCDILVPTRTAASVSAYASGAREAVGRSLRRASKTAYRTAYRGKKCGSMG